jgi:hypothetical protein
MMRQQSDPASLFIWKAQMLAEQLTISATPDRAITMA